MTSQLAQLIAKKWGLTVREEEILRCVVNGIASSRSIAAELEIAESTVDKHLESISKKTKLAGRTELTAFILRCFNDFAAKVALDATKEQPKPRVAVFDDEEYIKGSLVKALKTRGFDAVALHMPADSLVDQIEKEKPDVLVCDFVLPMITGFEIADRLRARGLEAPSTVIVTGYPDRLDGAPNQESYTVLVKPIDMQKLTAAIWAAVSSARARKTLISSFEAM